MRTSTLATFELVVTLPETTWPDATEFEASRTRRIGGGASGARTTTDGEDADRARVAGATGAGTVNAEEWSPIALASSRFPTSWGIIACRVGAAKAFAPAEIAAMAGSAGCHVIVDGAQAVGAIPVSAPALGVSAYAFSGQKWLLGPEGTGGLYVAADRVEAFAPTYVSFMGVDHERYRNDDPGSLLPAAGAQRYEFALPYRPGAAALAASLAWVRDQVGHDAAFSLIAANTRHCLEAARQLAGVEMLTPDSQLAGLVAFKVAGADPVKCVEHLAAHGALIRSIPENGALRLSCGFYNTPAEIDHALDLVREFARR